MIGVLGGQPAAFFCDPDGHDLVFFLVNRIENGRSRQQRDFVLAAAPAKQDANPKFLHAFSIRHKRHSTSKKLEQRLVKLCRLLDLRNVAAVLEHEQLGSSYAITKFLAAGQRN
jgi:hypothetical protein